MTEENVKKLYENAKKNLAEGRGNLKAHKAFVEFFENRNKPVEKETNKKSK